MEFYRTKIRPWLGVFALLLIGFMMLQDPHLMDHIDVSGRKAFTKLIFSYIWGIPCGILFLVIGILLGYRQIKK